MGFELVSSKPSRAGSPALGHHQRCGNAPTWLTTGLSRQSARLRLLELERASEHLERGDRRAARGNVCACDILRYVLYMCVVSVGTVDRGVWAVDDLC